MLLYKVIFADDTNLFMSNQNPFVLQTELNAELAKVDTWFKCNKLSLNIKKTNYIVFTTAQSQINTENFILKINKQEIERVRSTKFLGVMIDDQLNFKCHIDYLMLKLSKYLGLFYKIRHYLPKSAMIVLYKTLFEPHLDYCNVIWCNTYETHLSKLLVLQRKIIRAISWSEYRAHAPPLFHRLGLLRLTEFNDYHNVCIMFQVVNGVNARLSELIPIRYPQHTYSTRNTDHIYGKDRKLVCTGHSVVCRGPQLWNELDDRLRKVRSFSKFKKEIKVVLMSPYETE